MAQVYKWSDSHQLHGQQWLARWEKRQAGNGMASQPLWCVVVACMHAVLIGDRGVQSLSLSVSVSLGIFCSLSCARSGLTWECVVGCQGLVSSTK